METENFSSSQFADEIDVQRAVISHIMTERNRPTLEVVSKIMDRFPNINPDWLLFGKGQMRRDEAGHAPQTPISQDLFANAAQIRHEEKKTPEIRPGSEVKRPAVIVQPTVKESVNTRETPARKAVRITVFYSNNTYETFVPEK
jgi:plasmid maintenance system antidote protein VapI